MSYHMPKNILIFGATGAIGKYITEEIVAAKSSFGKIGIFTSEATASAKSKEIQALKDQGVEVIVGDLGSEKDVADAYKGYDTVVSCIGRGAIEKQIDLIRLAEESDTIHRFLPSEYGTDIEYGPSSATEKPHQLKLKVRKYIRENTKRVEVTYVVTGPYSDMFMDKGFKPELGGGFDPKNHKAVLLGSGDEKVSFTTMKDTGRLVVAALTHPEASKNKALKVNSFTVTGKEIVEEFERQSGAKWAVDYVPLEQLKQHEKESWENGEPWATGFTLRRIWTEGGTLYDKRDNGLIGEPETESLADQVKLLISRA